MKRISFNPRFVNKAGNNLIAGKIHTIRQNYIFWKRFEGRDVALFTWEGKPYRSKQIIFCVKKIMNVQEIEVDQLCVQGIHLNFYFQGKRIKRSLIAVNDGFKIKNYNEFKAEKELLLWFENNKYKSGKMAIIHFTDFKYGGNKK